MKLYTFNESDENGSRIGIGLRAFGGQLRVGVIRCAIPTLWFFATPTVAAQRWICPYGSWSMRLWRFCVGFQPDKQ